MTTLTILYLIFAKDASIKENKFITPTIMKKVLYIRALKNKVRSYISKSLWKDFQNWWGENNILTFKDLPTFFFLKKHKINISSYFSFIIYLTNSTQIPTNKKLIESHNEICDIKFKQHAYSTIPYFYGYFNKILVMLA